ncbi:PAS domain S-box-containing protein [Candidatus Kryptonium thompsonii]|uniref:histidine kinase n=2 Tax=Candidatus Kryptonium thompsonii TaxID=1633631 RepID=A0A0P1LV63_9BACT|nr:ATP-binding protein [Candidatus Kryptonium thompsoni]CUS78528.1 PAS domain S-box-containing protein [Candidatus Kryptonium thompsoni]CUS79704.1 PAS domain S-box-containing protein [Candidatus Kryptonium thompsoni]CUS83834.1 PAS domain S-box-containing protein [Candidatus Kryptonium thompsoni]CUS84570.1 PAS domain S-box-containing protein [Candidatus Kryptonium thompsoni]CUS85010.1 PAS domain S-box-containing protein [Candidatus Kryptonium thompsoni]
MRILIVDDVDESLELLKEVFEAMDYIVLTANNGVEALKVLNDEKVDVIISDVLMPKMDGFQFCREVKKQERLKDIPFIFYTANYTDPEDEKFGLSLGADAYLIKPIDIQVLINTVEKMIQKKRTADATEVSSIDDVQYLREYNTVLIRKLEDKMYELERANEMLRQMNEELQISHEQYKSLFENAGKAIFIVQPETWVVIEANNQAEELLKCTRDEILNLSFERYKKFFQPLFEGEKVVNFETTIIDFEGTEKIVEMTAKLIGYAYTSTIQVIVSDLTEKVKIQEELIQAEKLASLGRLSAAIAHEIRNPLSAISVNLQFLLKKFPEGSQERKYLDLTLEGVRRIEKIVEATLNFARPSKPIVKDEDINEVINATLPLVEISTLKKKIEVIPKLEPELPKVKIDFKQIQQVILNILTNAVDAIENSGWIKINSYLEDEGGVSYVVVSIADSGCGIPKDELNKIFEPFYTKKSDGTGLGLAISRQIMNNHGGKIEVESEVGRGTTFYLKFKVK